MWHTVPHCRPIRMVTTLTKHYEARTCADLLARLDELNILLNLDKRENEIVDGEPDESEPKEKKRDMER